MTITAEAGCRIARPPEAVVRVILDPAKAPLWNSGLERFEVVAGASGQVGAVGLLHYRQGGRCYVMEDRLLVADPGERYVSRVRGNGLAAHVETLLAPSGDGGTLVTVRWHGRGTRPLVWLMLPFMRRTVMRGLQRDLGKLRDVVEGTERAPIDQGDGSTDVPETR